MPDATTNVRTRQRAIGRWLFPVIVALGAAPLVAVAQFIAHLHTGVLDDHFFAYVGQRLADGAALYLDVWDHKPPGIFWLDALVFRLTGPDHYGGIVALCTLASVLAIGLFFFVARQLYDGAAATLTTLLATLYLTHGLFFAGGNRAETFILPCELAAAAVYLAGERRRLAGIGRRGARRLLGCGAFVGVALLFKQSAFDVLGAIVLHIVLLAAVGRIARREAARRIVAVLAGVMIPLLSAAVVLAWQGALVEAIAAIFNASAVYVGRSPAEGNSFDWWLRWFGQDAAAVLRLPLLMAVAAWLHAVARFIDRRTGRVSRDEPDTAAGPGDSPPFLMTFLAVWFVLALAGAMASPLSMGHYWQPLLPPLLLAAGRLIALLKGEMGLFQRLARRVSLAVVLVLAGYFARDAVYRQFQLASGVYWSRWSPQSDNDRAFEPTPYEAVGRALDERLAADATIQCWDYLPGVYLAARRPGALPILAAVHGDLLGKHDAETGETYAAMLMEHAPTSIVFRGATLERIRARSESSAILRRFVHWLDQTYEDRRELGRPGLKVFVLRGGRTPARQRPAGG